MVNKENMLLMKNCEIEAAKKAERFCLTVIVLNLLDANYLCNRLQVTKSLLSEDMWSVSGREFSAAVTFVANRLMLYVLNWVF
jgi:hypothetical protein